MATFCWIIHQLCCGNYSIIRSSMYLENTGKFIPESSCVIVEDEMKFKVGDRVRVKPECVGRNCRDKARDGGSGIMVSGIRQDYWATVKLDNKYESNYELRELILLEDTMETYTVKGVTYKQLKDITPKALIFAGARDADIVNLLRTYGYDSDISLTAAIDYCTEGPYACPEKVEWLVKVGFVEKVEERKLNEAFILANIRESGHKPMIGKGIVLGGQFTWSIEEKAGCTYLVPKLRK